MLSSPVAPTDPEKASDTASPNAAGTSGPQVAADEGTVWLVSFGDEDDRELRPPEIAEALRRGEITAETIAWREGLGDWLPISGIPELARLLPASGETEGSSAVTVPKPVQGSESTVPLPRVLPKEGPKASATRTPLPKPPSTTGTAMAKPPVTSASATPAWKGKTRQGLPTAKLADRTLPTPPVQTGTPTAVLGKSSTTPSTTSTGPKKFEFKKVVPRAPSPGKATTTPLVENWGTQPAPTGSETVPLAVPKVAPKARAAEAADAGAPPKRAGSIWDNDDDEPVSVEPELVRPLSPSPAAARAKGQLANPKPPGKKPPPPPTPPRRKQVTLPWEGETGDAGTPTIEALAAPMTTPMPARAAEARAGEDIFTVGGSGLSGAVLGTPTIDLANAPVKEVTDAGDPAAFALPVLDRASESAATVDVTPTVPHAESRPAIASRVAESTAPVKATEPAKKRGALPLILGGLGAAAVLALVLRGGGQAPPVEEPKPAEQETPRALDPAQTKQEPVAPEPSAPATVGQSPETPEPEATAAADKPLETQEAKKAEKKSVDSTPAPQDTKAEKPSSSKTEKPAAKEPSAAPADTAPAPKPEEKKPSSAPAAEQPQVDVGGDFDKGAAAAALAGAADEASACRKEGDPAGVAIVHVTFSNAGRATRATVEGPPFAGTATGGCIAATLRRATVPPYGGDRVTVTKRVVIH